MPNYKIIVEYDGTNFFGWQFQKDQRTVQGEIESALRRLSGGKTVRIHGAGRTDAGVHARGQVANFKLEKRWKCEELRNAINGNIGEDVLIHACEIVPDDFHARFSAKRRLYRYICRTNNSIIDRRYVWRIPEKLNFGKLQQCAELILGEYDFTSFSKYVPDLNHRRCTIYQSEWIKRKDLLIYMIEANRFLQHMIRYLVGTMVEVATGKLSVNEFKAILNEKNSQAKVSKAPSKGLYLEKITY